MAGRAVDLGIAHVAPVVQQAVDDLARTLGREAPVGGEGHHQEIGCCPRQRRWQVAAIFEGGIVVVQRLGGEQVGVGVEIAGELVALMAQVGLDLDFDLVGVCVDEIGVGYEFFL